MRVEVRHLQVQAFQRRLHGRAVARDDDHELLRIAVGLGDVVGLPERDGLHAVLPLLEPVVFATVERQIGELPCHLIGALEASGKAEQEAAVTFGAAPPAPASGCAAGAPAQFTAR